MRFYSDNPALDFDRHDAAQQAELAKLPKCEYCGKTIQDDYYYEICDEVICEECLDNHFKKRTEDFIN